MQRNYWLLLPVVAVMSLTRPSGLAFALAMLMHAIHRWVTRRRDPFPVRERVAVIVVGLWSFLCGIGWLLIAWGVTGSLTAYLDTELAWRRPVHRRQGARAVHAVDGRVPSSGSSSCRSRSPTSSWCWSWPGSRRSCSAPWMRRLGPDLRFWTASYALYLLAVFFPQSSTFRLLMPLFPALGAVAQVRLPALRALIVFAVHCRPMGLGADRLVGGRVRLDPAVVG